MGRGKVVKAPPGQKWCASCESFLDIEQFGIVSTRKDGRDYQCKECHRKRRRVIYNRNPDKHIDHQYKYHYGIEAEAYWKLFEEQKGVCASCGDPVQPRRKNIRRERLSVDHDHATGKVRGLLCVGCNTALGSLQESPERILALLAYLKKHTSTEDQFEQEQEMASD